MLLLGLDFESSGIDPEVHSVTEVGAVLWDTDLHAPTRSIGYLVDPGPDTSWQEDCAKLTGLTADLCAKSGYPSEKGLKQLLLWYNMVDAVIAHNGNHFDRRLFDRWCAKHDWEVDKKLWIDTMTDLPLPPKASRKLVHMAAEHGFLNPFPHRALFDVMTMLKVFDQYPLEDVLRLAKSPARILVALVSREENAKAKSLGYYWKPDPIKQWRKDIKLCNTDEEIAKAKEVGFEARLLEEDAV